MGHNRRLLSSLAIAGAALALAVTGIQPATADPGLPGDPPPGTPSQIWSTVGADAFAELTNNIANNWNGQSPAPARIIASYDAVNPVTGAAGETIHPKPGCDLPRPNGANAGITAILANQKSTVDTNEFCVDFVRSSRAKNIPPGGDANLTFYAQSADAVSYAVLGNAYAPVAPLSKAQLKDIFECTIADWSEVGGQAGPIHLYIPPASAATYTFFLQAIGTNITNAQAGCNGVTRVIPAQQNDGRTVNGDPLGIAPYAVTKWAAQSNGALGIQDFRGGVHIGLVNTTTPPFTTAVLNATTYTVLNPSFATGTSASFGRRFYNVVRNGAPQELKDLFKAGGYVCLHADEFLIPYGNTPLGADCGQES